MNKTILSVLSSLFLMVTIYFSQNNSNNGQAIIIKSSSQPPQSQRQQQQNQQHFVVVNDDDDDDQQKANKNTNNLLYIQSLDSDFYTKFEEWANQFGVRYIDQKEKQYRLKVFISSCKQIYHHNYNKQKRGLQHTLGLNKFSDRTKQEYIDMLGLRIGNRNWNNKNQIKEIHFKNQLQNLNLTFECVGTITITPNPPEQVDWAKKAVSPVIDQGQCGSSYAISAVAAIEGLYALRIGKLQTFSVQQILDCSNQYGNQGCFGGFIDQSFWYMIDNGATTLKYYPNKNKTDKYKCVYTKSMKVASIGKCADVPSGNYLKLQSAVAQQPVSVALDASELQHYDQGIYKGNCSESSINQAMVIVGYGTSDNQTYWKIKNSVGTSWGEQGYLLLERQEKDGPGKCGVQLIPSVPQTLS